MKMKNTVMACALLACMSAGSMHAENRTGVTENNVQTVTVDPATRYQTLEGWGSSLC